MPSFINGPFYYPSAALATPASAISSSSLFLSMLLLLKFFKILVEFATLFMRQGHNDAGIGDWEVAGAPVQHSLVPVAVNLALEEDDVTLLEGQLCRVLSVKVVQGLAGGLRVAGGGGDGGGAGGGGGVRLPGLFA